MKATPQLLLVIEIREWVGDECFFEFGLTVEQAEHMAKGRYYAPGSYMTDPAHKQEVSQMLADASKSTLDDALKTWDVCMQVKAFVADGGISDSATERVRDTLLQSGDIKQSAPASAYVDLRFAKSAAGPAAK